MLVRADGGREVGGGHVIRCITLADSLRRRGADVTFALRDDTGGFVERIVQAGHAVRRMPDQPLPHSLLSGPWPHELQELDLSLVLELASGPFDAVVVDHYGLDAHWENGVKRHTSRVLAIDDLANRRHDVDIIVDQNWYGGETMSRYHGLVDEETLQLLGPRYALLQSAYAAARRHLPERHHPPHRIVVSFGGSDPKNETERVLAGLSTDEFRDIAVDVVVGARSALTDRSAEAIRRRPNTELHVGLPTMANLLLDADLVIGASGSGTWERLCLDVPAIVTTTSAAHSGVTSALASAGITVWAGISGEVSGDDYRELLLDYMAKPPPPSPPLVDGRGAERIALALTADLAGKLTLRPATSLDVPQFIGSDPSGPPGEGRQLDGPEVWAAERSRFWRGLDDTATALLVVEVDGTPVGRARADLKDESVRVAYSLDDHASAMRLAADIEARLGPGAWRIDGNHLWFVAAAPPHQLPDRGASLYASFEIPAGTIAPTEPGS